MNFYKLLSFICVLTFAVSISERISAQGTLTFTTTPPAFPIPKNSPPPAPKSTDDSTAKLTQLETAMKPKKAINESEKTAFKQSLSEAKLAVSLLMPYEWILTNRKDGETFSENVQNVSNVMLKSAIAVLEKYVTTDAADLLVLELVSVHLNSIKKMDSSLSPEQILDNSQEVIVDISVPINLITYLYIHSPVLRGSVMTAIQKLSAESTRLGVDNLHKTADVLLNVFKETQDVPKSKTNLQEELPSHDPIIIQHI
ncbi:MAG: hypothetical protein JWQ35_696 [Bacteriovoracaceae bacterium]|nr:hypothetical protein [Bacteriovoracaceae bacterium]